MLDDETDEEELEDEMEDEWGEREFVSDISGDEDEDDLSDLEDAAVHISPFLHVPGKADLTFPLQEEGSDESEGSDEEEGDSDEEEEEEQPKSTLGKRKAAPSKKPVKKRPDKKPKSAYASLPQIEFISQSLFNRRTQSGGGIRTRDGIDTPFKISTGKLVASMIYIPTLSHSLRSTLLSCTFYFGDVNGQ